MPGWYPLPDDETFDARAIMQAFETGDLEQLNAELHHPDNFPNCPTPLWLGAPLVQAIYSSPVAFIRQLLEIGADPNQPVDDGFPPLIAATTSERPERFDIVKLLLSFGADTQQRGVNGWFPLHCAVTRDDDAMIDLLLQHGADINARTNVDDYSTALEDAEQFNKPRAAAALRKHLQR